MRVSINNFQLRSEELFVRCLIIWQSLWLEHRNSNYEWNLKSVHHRPSMLMFDVCWYTKLFINECCLKPGSVTECSDFFQIMRRNFKVLLVFAFSWLFVVIYFIQSEKQPKVSVIFNQWLNLCNRNFQISFLIFTLNISISWMKCLFIYTKVPIEVEW